MTLSSPQSPRLKDEQLPHIVIIGAGFGGLRAARALRKQPARITIIDRTNHHLFQPLLYQVATAALSPADISIPIRRVLRRQKNTEVIMADVTSIDIQERQVHIRPPERSIAYDYLIVATGSHENYFGHADTWKPLAPGLKTIEDARAIRTKLFQAFERAEQETDPDRIKELLTFVVVGGGPTGVEMAGAMAEVARKTLSSEFRHIDPGMAHILLIEALPRILGAFPESLAQKALDELHRLGVDVRTNMPLEEVDEQGVVAGGVHIRTQTVIWTAGVQATPVSQELPAQADRSGRVQVEADLTLPGHPEVFVIGDAAGSIQNGKPLPAVAPVALQQGSYVAEVIAQRLAGQANTRPFHYRNKGNMASIGRGYAITDLGRLRFAGFPAWLLWLVVHIMYLIGFQNRIMVMLQWAWSYVLFERRARILSVDDSPSKRKRRSGKLSKQESGVGRTK